MIIIETYSRHLEAVDWTGAVGIGNVGIAVSVVVCIFGGGRWRTGQTPRSAWMMPSRTSVKVGAATLFNGEDVCLFWEAFAAFGLDDWSWQSEMKPGSDLFNTIIREGSAGDPFAADGETLELSEAETGLRVRVQGRFQDNELVFETVFSASELVSGVPGDPGAVPAIEFVRATFNPRANQLRLRVNGTVFPASAVVSLFAPGTVDVDGVSCAGTFITSDLTRTEGWVT